MPPAVVLVTGVSRWLGGALAAELAADPAIERVIGVDTVPPAPEVLRRLGRTEFVRADIRSPLIGKVIESASVDTVVHMNISATPAGAGGRVSMKELNVIGTMQLLAACQRSAGVRNLVVRSTVASWITTCTRGWRSAMASTSWGTSQRAVVPMTPRRPGPACG